MHTPSHTTEARERVLDAAEHLFAQKGYASVTLRDIATAVGIRHASLYHHVPGGKEQLFIEVLERHFKRHHDGLTQALCGAEPDIRAQLYAVADWLLSQPPMDLMRLLYSDMPAIDSTQSQRLCDIGFTSLLQPIEQILHQAQQRGEIEHHNLGLMAGALFGMIESLYCAPEHTLVQTRQQMAYEVIDVLLTGLGWQPPDR